MAKGRFVKKTVPVTTNNLTTAIVNQILSDGWSASRVNTTGIYDKKINRYRPSGSRKGFCDVIACIKGRFVAFEVKNSETDDEQSTDQKDFQIEVQRAGGLYFLIENSEQFNQIYKDLLLVL